MFKFILIILITFTSTLVSAQNLNKLLKVQITDVRGEHQTIADMLIKNPFTLIRFHSSEIENDSTDQLSRLYSSYRDWGFHIMEITGSKLTWLKNKHDTNIDGTYLIVKDQQLREFKTAHISNLLFHRLQLIDKNIDINLIARQLHTRLTAPFYDKIVSSDPE